MFIEYSKQSAYMLFYCEVQNVFEYINKAYLNSSKSKIINWSSAATCLARCLCDKKSNKNHTKESIFCFVKTNNFDYYKQAFVMFVLYWITWIIKYFKLLSSGTKKNIEIFCFDENTKFTSKKILI